MIRSNKQRIPLQEAHDRAQRFGAKLGCNFTLAGSIRRRKETVGDIDMVAIVDSGGIPPKAIPGAALIGGGDRMRTYEFEGTQINLWLHTRHELGAAILYATGSAEFNLRMRATAKRKGWKLNQYGLFDGDNRLIASESEAEIFSALGMRPIEPQDREKKR